MRIVVVANRLPQVVEVVGDVISFAPASGGLTSSFTSLFAPAGQGKVKREFLWIGWPGALISEKKETMVEKWLQKNHFAPVFLSKSLNQDFYSGFCNRIAWPLFHYFPERCSFQQRYFDAYKTANELFANKVVDVLEKNDIVLIQDYQLLLLPKMLRKLRPSLSTGFFLHIPFPSFEVFRLFPRLWRKELLEGMLGADVVGFHTYDYVRYFQHCVSRVLGIEQNFGKLFVGDRMISMDVFPLGIDVARYTDASRLPKVELQRKQITNSVSGKTIVMSVDRLDYTKGIENRLLGFELFLRRSPQFHKKATFIMVTIPSRTEVSEYQQMKRQIDGLVGRINGSFGSIDWTPVIYLYRSLTFEELIALYTLSSVALVTPLRDGMNLVAKEYVATHQDKAGVLILSEMTGAAQELIESIIVNPSTKEEIADGLMTALTMPDGEQKERMHSMGERIKRNDISKWLDDFLKAISDVKAAQITFTTREMSKDVIKTLHSDYRRSKNRLLLLDYDGTLVPFYDDPQKARPPEGLFLLLSKLTSEYKNHVCILSGRDKKTLDKWFGKFRITLVAEHGAWIKEEGSLWKTSKPLTNTWKPIISALMKKHVDRLPGSFIEEKEFSLSWHYRNTDPILGSDIALSLREELVDLAANQDISVLWGNKVIEVISSGAHKGMVSVQLFKKQNYDFILSVGDDTTDEAMFASLPPKASTVKVGSNPSQAKYFVEDYHKVLELLSELTNI